MNADNFSTPRLTPEFCKQASGKLVFHPESVEEAEFIGQALNSMGFRFYNPVSAKSLEVTLTGSIYLDTDKTIMVSGSRNVDGTQCSIEGFDQFFLPRDIRLATPRLTQEDCRQKTLIIYPRTAGEARGVMQTLLTAGVTMDGDASKAVILTARPIIQGIVVRDGRLGFGPTAEDLRDGQICTPADLGVVSSNSISPEQATMISAFNEITARISQLASRVEAIEKEVLPRKIDKPEISPPAGLKTRP